MPRKAQLAAKRWHENLRKRRESAYQNHGLWDISDVDVAAILTKKIPGLYL